MKTDAFWKQSMLRQDYSQLKAENQATHVSPEQSLGDLQSRQVTLTHNGNLLLQSELTEGFFTSSKRFLSWGTYFNSPHAFVPCHLQGQNLTTLSAFVVSLCRPGVHVPKDHCKNIFKERREQKIGWGNTHRDSYCCILEMVIYKMEIHG